MTGDIKLPNNLGLNLSDDLKVFQQIDGDARLAIQRVTSKNTSYADLLMNKDTSNNPWRGRFGSVSAMLRIQQTVGASDSFQWPFLVSVDVQGGGSGEHCAGYFQGIKRSNNSLWTMCTELRDLVANPQTGSVGWECGIFGRGVDNGSRRLGIDMSYWSGMNYDAGDHEIGAGIRIGPSHGTSNWYPGTSTAAGTSSTTGRIIMNTGISIAGNVGTGIDLSGIRNDYSTTAIRLVENARITWNGGSSFGANGQGFIMGPPPGALGGSTAMPGSFACTIKVNIDGVGTVRLPFFAA